MIQACSSDPDETRELLLINRVLEEIPSEGKICPEKDLHHTSARLFARLLKALRT